MSTTLAAELGVTLEARVKNTGTTASWTELLRLGSTLFPTYSMNLTDGTSADQAQKVYAKSHTITASSSATINLNSATGDITALGAIDFANVKLVLIRVRSPGTGVYITVGNAASDPWAPFLSSTTATIDVDDVFLITAPDDGWTVGAAANLKLANATLASITADVVLIGH